MAVAQEFLERPALIRLQEDRLRALLSEIVTDNRFYAGKFARAGLSASSVNSLEEFRRVPFTTKAELIADQEAHPPYGEVHTYPLAHYTRFHQTSGTKGQPLRWLDTPQSWDWLLRCWEIMYRIAGIQSTDRLFFPFSFGPFLGFWSAFDAGSRLGCLCLPGGGMSSAGRLRFLIDNKATVVLCTPTYAQHLAEVATELGIDLAGSSIRAVIVAGEPGGSISATRGRIESAWGARVFDHSGLTEVGAASIECPENPAGLHLLESEYIGEVIEPGGTHEVAPGEIGELVLTNLGRYGSPLLRYRTGDLVRRETRPCSCGRVFARFDGGILARTDDMIQVRGNNLYPSALEAVIRRFPEVAEYRVEVDQTASLAALRIELEPVTTSSAAAVAERVERAIRDELLFRAEVKTVAPGSLPRYEMKSRRVQVKTKK